ncbi:hypothetical protein Pmani_016648 [Petrolisthes manimaculis]|uniref:Uncharacterized protein n=1 Tax=Petrolisthes manimaculis TaxID=1843537 RepID=A0AAE1PR88_9EUCA|nr:hypothetical protein Pmani_016648 [Petrolisthes manimaculis]
MFICLLGNGDEAIPMLNLNHHLQMSGGYCHNPPPTPTVETPTNALSNTYVTEPTVCSNTYLAPPISHKAAALPNSRSAAPPWTTPQISNSQASPCVYVSQARRDSQSSPLHGSQLSPGLSSHAGVGEGLCAGRSFGCKEEQPATTKSKGFLSAYHGPFSDLISSSKAARPSLLGPSSSSDQSAQASSSSSSFLSVSHVPR